MVRNKKIAWLKGDSGGCRILTNARCLSEGVDVPSLDAVMFLSPRNSVIDIVQSVGRVMRIIKDKNFGYIILPIVIPNNLSPEEALNDNKKYRQVWQVLQALRAHDDRFNHFINKIEFSDKKNNNNKVDIIGVDKFGRKPDDVETIDQHLAKMLVTDSFEEYVDAIFTKMVKKCGDREYLTKWTQDIINIANRNTENIADLIKTNETIAADFKIFTSSLQRNINKSITENDAIEMLSQHLITKPIFNALFSNYSFASNNPVSIAMDRIILKLETENFISETKKLERFYKNVQKNVEGISAKGKQKVIIELYERAYEKKSVNI